MPIKPEISINNVDISECPVVKLDMFGENCCKSLIECRTLESCSFKNLKRKEQKLDKIVKILKTHYIVNIEDAPIKPYGYSPYRILDLIVKISGIK